MDQEIINMIAGNKLDDEIYDTAFEEEDKNE